ncbi:hypothetical protein LINGRAHAP2_LOCUS22702 [Linum grandiflorum]
MVSHSTSDLFFSNFLFISVKRIYFLCFNCYFFYVLFSISFFNYVYLSLLQIKQQ